jgi:hypothetical protein
MRCRATSQRLHQHRLGNCLVPPPAQLLPGKPQLNRRPVSLTGTSSGGSCSRALAQPPERFRWQQPPAAVLQCSGGLRAACLHVPRGCLQPAQRSAQQEVYVLSDMRECVMGMLCGKVRRHCTYMRHPAGCDNQSSCYLPGAPATVAASTQGQPTTRCADSSSGPRSLWACLGSAVTDGRGTRAASERWTLIKQYDYVARTKVTCVSNHIPMGSKLLARTTPATNWES